MEYIYRKENITKSELCKRFVLEWMPESIPDYLQDYVDYEYFVEDELRMSVTSVGNNNAIISNVPFDELDCYYL